MLNIPAGWKPIESAPKDGTDILLTNGVHVSCGHWHYDEGGTTEHRDLDGRYIGQDDRDGFAGWLDWMGGMTPNPTHWMPLPAAPGSPASVAPGDAQDDPIGTLSRDADETIRFTPARDFLVTDGMPVFSAPAAGDALDSKRLKWIAQNAWALRDLDNGRKNSLVWQQPRTVTEGALNRLRAAVDAALAAQVPQQGEA